MTTDPYFSIIVPMYNRQRTIQRAILSCIKQGFGDFEVIVVDDGSTDLSVNLVRQIGDDRARIIMHESNRGVGPARNTGIAHARGQWIICLDSDDELLPGALETIFARISDISGSVDGLRFACVLDDGRISPDPPLVDARWSYEDYLRWMEGDRDGLKETMPVVRKRTFESVRYPDGRALESEYHLDFARLFTTWSCPAVVRAYHSDASNQLTRARAGELLLSAADQALSVECLIVKHGEEMARIAPQLYIYQLQGLLTLHLLAGDRRSAWRTFVRLKRNRSRTVRAWIVFILGIIDRRLLAFLKATRVNRVK